MAGGCDHLCIHRCRHVAPNGMQAGWSLDQSWVWEFEEAQQAVGFDLLDVTEVCLLKDISGMSWCTIS